MTQPQAILVADDDAAMRYLISAILTGAGFKVDTAADGRQAYEGLQRDHYDLLVTDNEMPHLAGIGLIRQMRAAGMNLPVIIASGSFPEERVHDYQRLGIAAVVMKPFDFEDLLNAVRNALEACSTTQPQAQGIYTGLQQVHG